jgi:enamine deaminase RidA (YjgF/YER057c/UK114 family)
LTPARLDYTPKSSPSTASRRCGKPEKKTSMTDSTSSADSVQIRHVNPDTLAKPSGFTHAVCDGHVVYLSGQTAMDANGRIVSGGIVEQFRQALTNLLEALRAAGGDPSGLLSVRIHLVDIPEYQAHGKQIGQIWRELAGTTYPAMTAVGVTALWQPEALIEIEGVAALRGGG